MTKLGLYSAAVPLIIHKGLDEPIRIKLYNINNTVFSAAEMAAITKIAVNYAPTISGVELDPAETINSTDYPAGFDFTTYASTGEIIINLGGVDFTPGRDREAELIVYDTYANGRVIGYLDIKVSTDVAASATLVDPLNSATIVSSPAVGQYRVTGIRLDADKKLVITYDETPVAE